MSFFDTRPVGQTPSATPSAAATQAGRTPIRANVRTAIPNTSIIPQLRSALTAQSNRVDELTRSLAERNSDLAARDKEIEALKHETETLAQLRERSSEMSQRIDDLTKENRATSAERDRLFTIVESTKKAVTDLLGTIGIQAEGSVIDMMMVVADKLSSTAKDVQAKDREIALLKESLDSYENQANDPATKEALQRAGFLQTPRASIAGRTPRTARLTVTPSAGRLAAKTPMATPFARSSMARSVFVTSQLLASPAFAAGQPVVAAAAQFNIEKEKEYLNSLSTTTVQFSTKLFSEYQSNLQAIAEEELGAITSMDEKAFAETEEHNKNREAALATIKKHIGTILEQLDKYAEFEGITVPVNLKLELGKKKDELEDILAKLRQDMAKIPTDYDGIFAKHVLLKANVALFSKILRHLTFLFSICINQFDDAYLKAESLINKEAAKKLTDEIYDTLTSDVVGISNPFGNLKPATTIQPGKSPSQKGAKKGSQPHFLINKMKVADATRAFFGQKVDDEMFEKTRRSSIASIIKSPELSAPESAEAPRPADIADAVEETEHVAEGTDSTHGDQKDDMPASSSDENGKEAAAE